MARGGSCRAPSGGSASILGPIPAQIGAGLGCVAPLPGKTAPLRASLGPVAPSVTKRGSGPGLVGAGNGPLPWPAWLACGGPVPGQFSFGQWLALACPGRRRGAATRAHKGNGRMGRTVTRSHRPTRGFSAAWRVVRPSHTHDGRPSRRCISWGRRRPRYGNLRRTWPCRWTFQGDSRAHHLPAKACDARNHGRPAVGISSLLGEPDPVSN